MNEDRRAARLSRLAHRLERTLEKIVVKMDNILDVDVQILNEVKAELGDDMDLVNDSLEDAKILLNKRRQGTDKFKSKNLK